ncbi:site-specific DNA-methyltransferase [Bradyrhizobium erythrophlei]|uniref:site-specific DNA-methyltransferase (adenine-specific) n=1 Tax=Bradyrhizobium erythrophlei TaxID=1437360 RepID=A0A1M7UHL0_9BRAD|nr:DNA methyltransferase [Bradyrhizobium erythrophlei]SHN82511.1 DNA modification methylase [Bradyrhizobium erythrophlei]
MPIRFGAKPAKTTTHVDDDPVVVERPRAEQPDPLGPQIRLDARIRAECVEVVPIVELHPNPKNAKKHPEKQIALLQANFEQFGFTTPLLVDEDNKIIAGHARFEAAKRSRFEHLPVIRLSHLTATQKQGVALADNRLAELSTWNLDILTEELSFLFDASTELDFDPGIVGFETVEIDQIIGDDTKKDRADPADVFATLPPETPAVTSAGDIWECDEHRLLCGDATNPDDYAALMGRDQVAMVFTDPPYNVPNAGHVSKREGVREFAMAAGEMSSREFSAFLSIVFGNIFAYMQAGAVGFFCMDWRHLSELWAAAHPVFGAMRNLIVWVKPNAGMGSFYRSQHELICVYATPGKPINNFGLGGKGRHRTNVWQYPGFNSFGRGRDETLAMHPTVKPVAMVVDALKDCSDRGGVVLDPFAGSGTTMIAAERTKRRARLMEIDPLYCDTIVERWQTFTGKTARLAETNETFAEVKARRGAGR